MPKVIGLLLVMAAIGAAAWYFVLRPTPAATASVDSTTVTTAATATTVSTPPVAAAAVVPPAVDTATATTTDAIAAADAATEAAASSKQCSLVTRAEMETILGAKIVRVTSNELTCAYFTDADRSAQVDTTWTGGKDALTQTKGFNSAAGLFTPIAGIGDEAYLQAAGVLHILKGDTYVVVNSREYPHELETESAIARRVMEKMK